MSDKLKNQMKMRFSKGSKWDRVEFMVDSESIISISNPRTNMIPHDLIHCLVESFFPFRGFVSSVFMSWEKGATLQALAGVSVEIDADNDEVFLAESLVESFQACISDNLCDFDSFLYGYTMACEGRSLKPQEITIEQFSECWLELSLITNQWNTLPKDGSMTLFFPSVRKQTYNYGSAAIL